MNRVVSLTSALFAVLLPVFQASAEESENAARLRTVTETMLRSLLVAPHDEESGRRLDYRIEMTEHSGGTIVAAIRDLVVHNTDTFHLGIADMVVKFGPVDELRLIDDMVVTYNPVNELRYTASTDIPSISGFHADGTEILRLATARWHVECVLRIDSALCEKSEMDVADLALTFLHRNSRSSLIKLDRLSSVSSLHETTARTWSGNTDIAFVGITSVLDGIALLSIGEAYITGEVHGVHEMLLRPTLGMDISLDALWHEWLENPAGAPDGRLLPIDHVSGFYTLSDFTWNGGFGPGVAAGSVQLDHSLTVLNGNEGAFRLRYRHDELDVSGVPIVYANLVPTDLALDLDLETLPIDEFTSIAIEQSDPMNASKPDPGMILSLLAEAGSTLQFELGYSGPALVASGTGHFAAVQKEPVPATGEANLVLAGLPDLVRQVRDDAMSGSDAAVGVVGFLALWQAMGRKEETSDGLRHHYDLELLPDGRILLNGNDLEVLLDLMGQN